MSSPDLSHPPAFHFCSPEGLPHPLSSGATSAKGIRKISSSMGGTSLKNQESRASFPL